MASPGPQRARSGRSPWLPTTAVALACALVVAGLDRAGGAARTYGRVRQAADPDLEVVVVPTDAAVVEAWRSRGLRGRTILHVGRFLHFVTDDERRLTTAALTAPGRGRALDAAVAAAATARSHLWAAASLGIARRILYLPPPASLQSRVAALGATAASLPLLIPIESVPRALVGSVPPVREPVLVEVNASWFDEDGAPDLVEALRASGLRTDLVVASLAEDADDVTPGARERLRAFVRRLAPSAEAGGR